MWQISAQNIGHKFNQRCIFDGISFNISEGQSIVITGPNGSGKTTLLRIICHLIRPSQGQLIFSWDKDELSINKLYRYLGLVGPYLQLYNDLSAFENYKFFAKIRGLTNDLQYFKFLMKRMGLAGRELDELNTYSSGMLQRAKYVMALIHQPPILILDEPTANLDDNGAAIVYKIMEEQKKDKILILATNEPEEFKFGEQKISLNS